MKRFKTTSVLFLTALLAVFTVSAIAAGADKVKYERSKEVTIKGTVQDVKENSGPSALLPAGTSSRTESSAARTDQPSTTPSTTTPSTSTTSPSTRSSTTPSTTTSPDERAGATDRPRSTERSSATAGMHDMDAELRGTWVTMNITDVGTSGARSSTETSSTAASRTASSTLTSGSTVHVYLAPTDHLTSKAFNISQGDQIEVTGARVDHHGTEFVLAREVKREGKTLNLRNRSGNPEWEKGSSGSRRSSSPDR